MPLEIRKLYDRAHAAAVLMSPTVILTRMRAQG